MREPGEEPQFDRLIDEIVNARVRWRRGEKEKAERILKLVALIAYADARERGPTTPRQDLSQIVNTLFPGWLCQKCGQLNDDEQNSCGECKSTRDNSPR
jgi:hypothetical protein